MRNIVPFLPCKTRKHATADLVIMIANYTRMVFLTAERFFPSLIFPGFGRAEDRLRSCRIMNDELRNSSGVQRRTRVKFSTCQLRLLLIGTWGWWFGEDILELSEKARVAIDAREIMIFIHSRAFIPRILPEVPKPSIIENAIGRLQINYNWLITI